MNFYVVVARTISRSFAALTREILFLPLEHKIHILSPPCNILCIITFAVILPFAHQSEGVQAYSAFSVKFHNKIFPKNR